MVERVCKLDKSPMWRVFYIRWFQWELILYRLRRILRLSFILRLEIFVECVVYLIVNPHNYVFLISYNHLSQPNMCCFHIWIDLLSTNKKLSSLQENHLCFLIFEWRELFNDSSCERVNMENNIFIISDVLRQVHSLVNFESWVELVPLDDTAIGVSIKQVLILGLFHFTLANEWVDESQSSINPWV